MQLGGGARPALDDQLELEDAEAKRRKADLKADKPPDLTGAADLEGGRPSSATWPAARSSSATSATRPSARRSGRTWRCWTSRLDAGAGPGRRRSRPRSRRCRSRRRAQGTVVYKQDWRGEKKKVGDGMWRGESVLEIAVARPDGGAGPGRRGRRQQGRGGPAGRACGSRPTRTRSTPASSSGWPRWCRPSRPSRGCKVVSWRSSWPRPIRC